MQNYRANAMPYNTYRQPSTRSSRDDKSLAMAYVPWQTWRNICDVEKGFQMGMIFQELNMPFLGKGGGKR